jgi:hypothetical protein
VARPAIKPSDEPPVPSSFASGVGVRPSWRSRLARQESAHGFGFFGIVQRQGHNGSDSRSEARIGVFCCAFYCALLQNLRFFSGKSGGVLALYRPLT